MDELSARARALSLLKAASDAGAKDQAMTILETAGKSAGPDASIDWAAAVLRLNALVKSLPQRADHGPNAGIEVTDAEMSEVEFRDQYPRNPE